MIKRNQSMLNALNLISDGVLTLLSYLCALWLRFEVLGGRQTLQLTSPRLVALIFGYCILIVLV